MGVVGVPLPPDARRDARGHARRRAGRPRLQEVQADRVGFPSPENRRSRIGDVAIGGDEVIVIAGPCSVETEEQTLETARAVHAAGAKLLRGGAYKPRTSPYEFRGLGEKGLEMLAEAREETGLADHHRGDDPGRCRRWSASYTDIFQIGARNCQNYLLLEEVGKADKPVMLKRGLSMLIEEWLLAAEYVMAQGNPNVILCERGIRTFETGDPQHLRRQRRAGRAELSHLPVFVDPSHAAGKRAFVGALSLCRDRRRSGRVDDRSPPEPGPRPLRRRAVARLRRVQRADATHQRRRRSGRPIAAGTGRNCLAGSFPAPVTARGHRRRCMSGKGVLWSVQAGGREPGTLPAGPVPVGQGTASDREANRPSTAARDRLPGVYQHRLSRCRARCRLAVAPGDVWSAPGRPRVHPVRRRRRILRLRCAGGQGDRALRRRQPPDHQHHPRSRSTGASRTPSGSSTTLGSSPGSTTPSTSCSGSSAIRSSR